MDLCHDDQDRTIQIMHLIDGEGADKFIGMGPISDGMRTDTMRFVIECPNLQTAFDRFDAARDAKLEEINRERRKQQLLNNAHASIDLSQ